MCKILSKSERSHIQIECFGSFLFGITPKKLLFSKKGVEEVQILNVKRKCNFLTENNIYCGRLTSAVAFVRNIFSHEIKEFCILLSVCNSFSLSVAKENLYI